MSRSDATAEFRVNPDSLRDPRVPRWFAYEALVVLLEGCVQEALPVVEDIGSEPVVNHARCQHRDAAAVMFEVAPVEETLAMGAGSSSEPKRSGNSGRYSGSSWS
ncbi:MAG: hypothetical protein ABSE56_03590 [Bryobacteraceae bacterium]|jgi:hypothetical protein